MLHRLLPILAIVSVGLFPPKVVAQASVERAATAYTAGDYQLALVCLSNIDGLLSVAPIFDRVRGEERERILFDLARCRYAVGDSTGAREVLCELFRNDPGQSKGEMDVGRDAALGAVLDEMRRLRRNYQQARINETSAFKAGLRSAILPGWGQSYRGRKRRGRFLLGSAGILAAVWVVADRSYKSALTTYRRTSEIDLSLPSRTGSADDPNPFQERFEAAESRASTARTVGMAFAAVWAYSVLENLVLQPGRVALTIPIE